MGTSPNGLLEHVRIATNNIRIGEEGNENKICGIKGIKTNKKRANNPAV
jgi:hypothetical protein